MNKLFAIALLGFATSAHAVNLQLLNHSHSPHYLVTEDTLSKGSLINQRLILSANYHHLNDPLVATNPERTERTRTLVKGMTTVQLGAGWQTSSRFLIGLAAPVSQVTFSNGSERQTGIGDTTVIGKYRVTANNDPTSIALIPSFNLPTGDEALFLGDGGVGAGLKLAMERDFGRFRINGNIGVARNQNATYQDIDYRNRFLAALGVHVPITDKWHWTAEGYTMLTKSAEQTPGEIVAGIQYFRNDSLSVTSGIGFGGFDSTTGNDWRFIMGLKWQPAIASSMQIVPSSTTPLSMQQEETMRLIGELNLEIRFDHDSDVLDAEDKNAVAQIAKLIKKSSLSGKLIIQGHANRIGEEDYNKDLSQRRARSVRRELIKQGIDPVLTQAVGFGQSQPIEHENRRMALDMSRRVDFLIQ
ncbi:MAG: hypothetical protein CME71_10135 [Halobacteriovorax sp.]|nr:hypothetical protein [Halobacteriovorax sp.]|tara:strand:- start:150 stop:1394 length:1245 start_codon:yes stop_codon:yes gene_type:complete